MTAVQLNLLKGSTSNMEFFNQRIGHLNGTELAKGSSIRQYNVPRIWAEFSAV